MVAKPSVFGIRMRRLREDRGWNQKELAERSGVDHGWINRLERGKGHNVSLDVARKIARVLGVSVDYLAGDLWPNDVMGAGVGTVERGATPAI